MRDHVDITGLLRQSFSKAKATKNVLSPLQWYLPFVSSFFLVVTVLGPPEFKLASFIGMWIFPGVFVSFYAYFAVTDRARLQTEEHVERMEMLNHSYQDDRGMLVVGSATANPMPPVPSQSATAISNPSPAPVAPGPQIGSATAPGSVGGGGQA